jgi:hypothetical protein
VTCASFRGTAGLFHPDGAGRSFRLLCMKDATGNPILEPVLPPTCFGKANDFGAFVSLRSSDCSSVRSFAPSAAESRKSMPADFHRSSGLPPAWTAKAPAEYSFPLMHFSMQAQRSALRPHPTRTTEFNLPFSVVLPYAVRRPPDNGRRVRRGRLPS